MDFCFYGLWERFVYIQWCVHIFTFMIFFYNTLLCFDSMKKMCFSPHLLSLFYSVYIFNLCLFSFFFLQQLCCELLISFTKAYLCRMLKEAGHRLCYCLKFYTIGVRVKHYAFVIFIVEDTCWQGLWVCIIPLCLHEKCGRWSLLWLVN